MKKQLLILMTIFTAFVGYSQTFIVNNITYTVTSTANNTVAVTNYNINGGTAVVIPATVTPASSGRYSSTDSVSAAMVTYAVTSIGQNAFFSKGITSVVIPNTVTSIAPQAFSLNSLTSAILGNSVTTIGFNAFNNNNLTSIIIPNSVTTIDNRAFDANLLTSVTIPSNVTTIGPNVFRDNPLTCVYSLATTPPNITTGTDDSFGASRGNINLSLSTGATAAYVTNPSAQWIGFNSVTEITGSTFIVNNITYLITSTTNNTVRITDYNTAGGTVVNIPATVSRACVTYSVTEIGNSAFSGNGITSVTIPNSIISIGASAFSNNPINTVLTIPNSVTIIGNSAFAQNNSLTSVILGNSVVSIGNTAFSFNNLSSITIPNSVTTIGDGAFVQNNNMTSVVIGSGVTSIGAFAFRFNGLTSLTIPNNVTSIGDYAFDSNSIATLVIGSGLTSIGTYVFSYNNITSITIPNSVTIIGPNAFQQNDITSIVIPNTVTSIGESAFIGNDLASVLIGNNVTTIGNLAFNTNNLTSVTIPASVTNIGTAVFQNNPLLTNVFSLATTPPTITTGTNDTFSTNRSTIHLHIPAGTLGAYVTNAGALWTGFNPVTEDALGTTDFEFENDIKVITKDNSLSIIYANSIRLENYTVYNMSGSEIVSGTENEIPTSTLASGIYILKLDFDKGTVVKKFNK